MFHALIFNISENLDKRNPGAHRIASFLREKGWDVEVIDWANFFTLDELKEIAKSRISSNTVFVGFSSFMSYWDDNIEAYCEWLKQKYPDVKTILGGQSSPKMSCNYIDYFVHGYGEYAILELVKSFVSPHEIKFDPLFTDKKVINAINSYPAFPMKSLKIDYQSRDYLEPTEWLTMEFARGCIFKCLYCNYPILGVKGDHTRDADDFYIEMQTNYDKWGVSNYFVADETFNDYSEKIVKYADAADRLSFKPFFSAFLRADLLAFRPQDWEPLSRLGMLGHFYGIESFNPATLKAIGKGANIEKVLDKLLEARTYFKTNNDGVYRGHIAIIVGLPHETIKTQLNTFKWLIENWQDESCVPYPLEIPYDPKSDRLSRLSKEYKEWGYKELEFSTDTFGINHVSKKFVWANEHMNLPQAKKICESWYQQILSQTDFKISSFSFHLPMYSGLNLKDAVNVSMKDSFNLQPEDIFGSRLASYKHNKLSL